MLVLGTLGAPKNDPDPPHGCEPDRPLSPPPLPSSPKMEGAEQGDEFFVELVLDTRAVGEWLVSPQTVANMPTAAAARPSRKASRAVSRRLPVLTLLVPVFPTRAATGRPAEASVTSPIGCATQVTTYPAARSEGVSAPPSPSPLWTWPATRRSRQVPQAPVRHLKSGR